MISAQHSLALGGALLAAGFDARSGRIPNWISLSLLALGLGSAALFSGPELTRALLGAFVTALPGALVFFATRGRGLGGGDVKILAGLGACLGAEGGLEAQLGALLLAFLQSACRLAWRGREGLADFRSTPLRFGPPLFVGTAYAIATAEWQVLP